MPPIQDYEILGIDVPYMTAASTTNGVDSTMAQVSECNALYGKYPSFILVSVIPSLPIK